MSNISSAQNVPIIKNINDHVVEKVTQFIKQDLDKRDQYKRYYQKYHCRDCGLDLHEEWRFNSCFVCGNGNCSKHSYGIHTRSCKYKCKLCVKNENELITNENEFNDSDNKSE